MNAAELGIYPQLMSQVPSLSGVGTLADENSRRVGVGIAILSATSPVSLLNNLVSYWKLDEVGAGAIRVDSQNGNSLNDPAANVVNSAGIISNGAVFNSTTNTYLYAPSNSTLQVTSDFTFSAWVKLSLQTGGRVVAKEAAGLIEYLLSYDSTNGFLGCVGNPSLTTDYAISGQVIANGVWTHIVFWYDHLTGQTYIRLNDSSTHQSTTSPALLAPQTTNFQVGNNQPRTAPIDAVVDEVGFWKRKLNAAEITALYNGGAGLPFSSFTT